VIHKRGREREKGGGVALVERASVVHLLTPRLVTDLSTTLEKSLFCIVVGRWL
jgi:hypothetical protein